MLLHLFFPSAALPLNKDSSVLVVWLLATQSLMLQDVFCVWLLMGKKSTLSLGVIQSVMYYLSVICNWVHFKTSKAVSIFVVKSHCYKTVSAACHYGNKAQLFVKTVTNLWKINATCFTFNGLEVKVLCQPKVKQLSVTAEIKHTLDSSDLYVLESHSNIDIPHNLEQVNFLELKTLLKHNLIFSVNTVRCYGLYCT